MASSSHQLRGRMGGFILHARYDSHEITAPARKAFLDRFEREADPAGVLVPEERARRGQQLLRAHMTRLAYKSGLKRKRTQINGADNPVQEDAVS